MDKKAIVSGALIAAASTMTPAAGTADLGPTVGGVETNSQHDIGFDRVRIDDDILALGGLEQDDYVLTDEETLRFAQSRQLPDQAPVADTVYGGGGFVVKELLNTVDPAPRIFNTATNEYFRAPEAGSVFGKRGQKVRR